MPGWDDCMHSTDIEGSHRRRGRTARTVISPLSATYTSGRTRKVLHHMQSAFNKIKKMKERATNIRSEEPALGCHRFFLFFFSLTTYFPMRCTSVLCQSLSTSCARLLICERLFFWTEPAYHTSRPAMLMIGRSFIMANIARKSLQKTKGEKEDRQIDR